MKIFWCLFLLVLLPLQVHATPWVWMDVYTSNYDFRLVSRQTHNQLEMVFTSTEVPVVGVLMHGQKIIYTRRQGQWKSVPMNDEARLWFALAHDAHRAASLSRAPEPTEVLKKTPSGQPSLLWKNPVMVQINNRPASTIGFLGYSMEVSGPSGRMKLEIMGMAPSFTQDEVFKQAIQAWDKSFQD